MTKSSQVIHSSPDVLDSWSWNRDRIREWQLLELNRQLRATLPLNRFYQKKFGATELQLSNLDELLQLPLTSKQELVQSAAESPSAISAHQTFDASRYSRIHRTSGTTGQPLMMLDTSEDWQWWSATWQHVLQAAEVTAQDRVFMAFSFGPFIGFWSAHQACVDRGATVIPGGGLSSLARLEFIRQCAATVVCLTPSYALHLAEIAEQEQIPLGDLNVRTLIVAGESGGSVPAVRDRLQSCWQANLVDHSGATEIGPWGFGWPDRPGLHVIETSFIAELLPLERSGSTDDSMSELVLTSLGRYGAPVFRYRTGDVVQGPLSESTTGGASHCNFLWFQQGVVGRVDNMVTVRGVNVFPSSIDALIREVPAVAEYQTIISRSGHLDQLQVQAECDVATCERLEKMLSTRLGLRIPVVPVQPNTLPRSELKSRRWIDRR